MLTRRDFLRTACLAGGCGLLNPRGLISTTGRDQVPPPRLPNIILILTDDQGYADLGCFDARGFTTPNVDRLAVEGCRFTNFHVAQPICSASRAGLLTGCYPNRIGIHGALRPEARHGLGKDEMTLAELLKQKGYATGMVGKWHLGHLPPFLPTRHGFDEWFGLPYSNDMWPHGDAASAKNPPLPLYENEEVVVADVTAREQMQLTTWYTERATRFIEKNRTRPFFLYVAHTMPHVPLHVSDKFRGKSEQGLYGDVIEEIDWSVGQIANALQRNSLTRDTWVMFMSDNGPWLSYGNHAGSARPLREGKTTVWEGGTRTPCVMRWPGHIPSGTTCSDMLTAIDLFPTIARQVGATLPAHTIDGLDVWPLIGRAAGAKNPHAAYWFYNEQNELQAVATGDGRWNLQLPHWYRTLGGRPGGRDGAPARYERGTLTEAELYDLAADIGETKNVAREHPEIVRRLQAEAEKARAELGDALTNRVGKGVRPALEIPR